MKRQLFSLLISLWAVSSLFSSDVLAQTCSVTDYIYLNDPQDYNTQGFVHKFKIGTGGNLTEIANKNGTMPWFPQGGGLGSPHGLGQDLNGNLYIGANTGNGPIAKIKCDGTLSNLNFINDAGFNIVSKDGYLYVNSTSGNRINRYSLCDGSLQGYVILNGVPDVAYDYLSNNAVDWGLDIAADGTIYATHGMNGDGQGVKAIYRFKPTNTDFTNHTAYNPFISSIGAPPGTDAAGLSLGASWLWGITHDNSGNMYVVAEEPWTSQADFIPVTWVLKYNASGTLVAYNSERQDTPTGGFEGARGIVYYPSLNVLYLAAGPDGDCIAKINPSNLAYLGAAAANIPNQVPKTLRIASEACPINASTKVDTTLCNVNIGDKIFLSQIVGRCNAPICGGTWTAAQTNAGMTFNACDLSFNVTGLTGCGKFILTNTGGTCGDFTIEVNVDFANVTAPVVAGSQTVCNGAPPAPFTVQTAATGSSTVRYQWQKSTVSCTSGFTNITGATSSTYASPAVSQTTYYRVIASVQGGCNFPLKTCSDTSNCVILTYRGAGMTAVPGTCTNVTNQYNVTGTISLTNAFAGTATITDGTKSTTVAIATGATSVAYSLTGLTSGTGSHTVVVSLPGCGTTSATYNAPASCFVAASVVVTSATVCYGSSATLTASGCTGTVSWNTGSTGTSLSIPALTATTNYTATCTTVSQTTFAVGTATVLPRPVLSLAASATNVTVNTPVSLSAIGCVGTVTWSTNATGSTISVTPSQTTQTYSATCVTGPGCLTTASITVNTQPAASLVVVSATVCYGSSATLVASGCTNGTVTWSNNTTGTSLITPNLTITTNYTAMCTTQTGSTTTAVGTATVMPQPVLSLAASSTNVTVGTPVSLSAIGCVGTVTWSTTATGNTISVTPSQTTQTYSATCVTGPGCLTTASITVNTQPAASLVVVSATVCYGSSATLTTSGCINGTVTWSNNTTGTSLITPNLTITTNYTAMCTTQTGSTTTAVGTATVMPQPVLSLAASSTNVTVGTPVSLSAIGCVGTVTWSTTATGNTISVTPSQTTQTYSATCVTGPGCLTTASITVNTQPAASLVVVSATVCYGSSATLTTSGCTNGTVTWSNNTTGTSLITPNLTTTTNYTATCTTQTGSTTTAVGTATVMPQPVLSLVASSTNVTVGTPVSLSAIGCVGTVTWSTNATGSTISVTPSQTTQTYSATCVTGPGCLTTASITVNTQPAASLVVVSATVCYGSSATLVASGCTSGTVTWSNNTTGNSLVTPALTQTTNYTATCTTQTGSTTTAVGTATVMPQPVLSLVASSTNVTVGTPVSLSAIGCVGTVTWSTTATGNTISVTPSQTTQTYSATCVTGPGCLTTASITLNTQPAASLVVVSATVCYGSSATLVASGCTNGTVTWSNNTTGTSLITPNLTITTNYTAMCTTQTGSTTTAVGTATVMPQPVLSLAASSTNVTVGTPVSLSAIGCVGTVTWSTTATGNTISVTPSQTTQTYSATCVTGPGCLTTASITVNTQPAASLVVVSATVCYGSSATLVASGCTGTVSWNTGSTGTSLVTPALTQTTNYTATCTTQTNSITFAVGTVTVVLPASLTISRTSAASSTAITVSVRGCTNGTLAWSTGTADNGKTSIVVPAAVSSQYSVTCTTGFGCRSTAQVSVGSGNTNDFIVADAMVCQGQSVTLTAIGCAGTLSWLGTGINGQTTTGVVVTPTQTQGYTAICTNGTSSVEVAAQVTVMAAPVVTLTAGSQTVATGSVVSLTAGGCVNGQLQWSIAGGGGSVVSATAVQGTNVYSVSCVVTPSCSDVKSVTVTGISGVPVLHLNKIVSASRAQTGDVISYTVTVSNTGSAAGYSIVVNDVLSAGLTVLPGSVSTTAGTYSVFSNQWTVGQLNAGAVATLSYSVSITADGVLYNTATIPGDTAKVCTSVPIKVCKGSDYAIRLNAPSGYSVYQWYYKPVSGVETKVYEGGLGSYTATQAGEYRVVVNANAACAEQSCCPIIIEEQEVPSFTVVAVSPTCAGGQAKGDGQLRVTGLGTNSGNYRYAVSEGTSFTISSPTLLAIPANGVVATGLAGNKSYTVRIYDGLGCYRDQTVLLPDTCVCPPAVCIPISVNRIVR